MVSTATQEAQPVIAPLDWETNHFGIAAGQLTDPNLDDDALGRALLLARGRGVRLLVWPTLAERNVPSSLLAQFDGALVDRKATYCKSIELDHNVDETSASELVPVVAYASPTPSESLIRLAISAGMYSRFRADHHIAYERFEAMYRIWIDRSIKKELADVVFIIPEHGQADALNAERVSGFITVSESQGIARIGLIAVAPESRGRGVGTTLMRAAHHWMLARRAHFAEVVTQAANMPACRLYHRSGYHLSRIQNIYHFWL